MLHSTPGIRMVARAYGVGQPRHEFPLHPQATSHNPPATYEMTPFAPYSQGTTGIGTNPESSETHLLITAAVMIVSILCITFSLVVIIMILGSKSTDDIVPTNPGEMTVSEERQETIQTLLVPQETVKAVPMTTPSTEATAATTTAAPITAAQTTAMSQTTAMLQTTTMVKTTTMAETSTSERTTMKMTTEKATPTIAATAQVTSQSGKRTGALSEPQDSSTSASNSLSTATSLVTIRPSSTETAMNRQPLLCTMGTNTYLTDMFPKDGLCDYIFYDSIHKKDVSTFDPPDKLDSDLRIFVEQRKEYSITAFGISFGFKHASFLTSNLSRDNEPYSLFMVGYFWKHNIYHFGVLDTPTNDVEESSVKAALDLLKLVNDFSEFPRTQGHSCFMAFAAFVPNTAWANFYVGAFANTVWPHIFIGLGHYVNGDNTFTDCFIMPPMVLERPAQVATDNSSYQHDLALAVGSFDMLTTNSTPPLWAISVTMKGRWTVPEEGETPNFLSRCVHDPSAESFGNIAQVCNDPDFERVVNDLQLHSTLIYGDNQSRVFSYDDEHAFREKLCRLKAEHTSIEFGIAVFDLEYEDFSNSCSYANSRAAFSRLKLLRRLIDFFRTKFHHHSDLAACSSLTR